MDKIEEAQTAFERALTLDPADVASWIGKGRCLRALRRPDDALAAFDHATELAPALPDAWNNKGVALSDLKRYEEALVAFGPFARRIVDPHESGNGVLRARSL
jgi:tetratricopeptide (TPR) repeat protein